MKIGDKVYIFDPNHRVYERDVNGRSVGGPIYREHFIERTIVGETKQCWIIDHWGEQKFKKNGTGKPFFTKEQVEEEVYKHNHAHKIADEIRRVDYKTLKAIAEFIEYGVSK